MKFTPSSTTRRNTALATSRSGGSPQMPGPVIRIAPKPMRCTVRSPPTSMVPEARAGAVSLLMRAGYVDGGGAKSEAGQQRRVDGFAAHHARGEAHVEVVAPRDDETVAQLEGAHHRDRCLHPVDDEGVGAFGENDVAVGREAVDL